MWAKPMRMKKTNVRAPGVNLKPTHERLPWPGLRAKDHLTRVVARVLKEAKETREREAWAENLIAWVLEHVPPTTVIRLVGAVTSRRVTRSRRY